MIQPSASLSQLLQLGRWFIPCTTTWVEQAISIAHLLINASGISVICWKFVALPVCVLIVEVAVVKLCSLPGLSLCMYMISAQQLISMRTFLVINGPLLSSCRIRVLISMAQPDLTWDGESGIQWKLSLRNLIVYIVLCNCSWIYYCRGHLTKDSTTFSCYM